MGIRKPNRVSRPVRVTQSGTSTSYPHANYAKVARWRNRWAGETSPHVLTTGVEQGWADPPDPREVDWSSRKQAIPFQVRKGIPRNPFESGLPRGRGHLGRWGENRAGDAVVFCFVDGVRYLLMVHRKDGRGWGVPGGFARGDFESYVATAARECREETGLNVLLTSRRKYVQQARYMSESRNTRFAWIVSVPVIFDLGVCVKTPGVAGADDAQEAMWVTSDSYAELESVLGGRVFAPHVAMLKEFL
jgi:ADP-ribose pyrophosphatase YjhB (NUDIX family)